jgi:hypothetical protein
LCCIYQQSEHTLENRGSQWLSFISILFVGGDIEHITVTTERYRTYNCHYWEI